MGIVVVVVVVVVVVYLIEIRYPVCHLHLSCFYSFFGIAVSCCDNFIWVGQSKKNCEAADDVSA
jgi:hypothetical protein